MRQGTFQARPRKGIKTMSHKVSNLTKAVIKNYPMFNIREDLDYADNGERNYGYDYEGKLNIVTSRKANKTYLAIDLYKYWSDSNFNFTWAEMPRKIEDACFRRYNGVSEIDMDDLVSTCEDVIRKLDAFDEQIRNEPIDMSGVLSRIEYERNFLGEILDSMRHLNWWEIPSEKILSTHKAFTNVTKADEQLRTYQAAISNNVWFGLSVKEKRQLVQDLKDYGCVKFNLTDARYSSLKSDIKYLMGIIASM